MHAWWQIFSRKTRNGTDTADFPALPQVGPVARGGSTPRGQTCLSPSNAQVAPAWTERGSGSVYPSPLGSRGSAEGLLDVSNLWRPGTEEKIEDEVLGVLCEARDIARERWTETIILATQLTLSHRCGTRNECNVMCGQSVRICTCCVRVTVHTPRRLPGNWKLPASEKQLPEQEKRLSESLLATSPPVLVISTKKILLFSPSWRSPIITTLFRLPVIVLLPLRRWRRTCWRIIFPSVRAPKQMRRNVWFVLLSFHAQTDPRDILRPYTIFQE